MPSPKDVDARAFYQAFRNSQDAMFYTDRRGMILDVNEAFVRRFGWTRDEMIGETPGKIRSPHTPPELYQRLWKDILDPAKGFWRGRIINKAKNGEELPVLLSITAVRGESGAVEGFVSSTVDLSELENLQKRLAKSESLATVGTMAAVVAHEIRNPLGSIVMAAKSLARGDLDAEERAILLPVLEKESSRLTRTLQDFLQYARPREPKPETGSVNELLREVLDAVRSDSDLLREVRVQEDLDPDEIRFSFDPDQIRQVVWNILINGIQAMGGKGKIRVSTRFTDTEVEVRVEDTGPGIPRDMRGKIFAPFTTGKKQGTGLGLAIAQSVAQSHGGRILVESEPGKGARFTVVLPTRRRRGW